MSILQRDVSKLYNAMLAESEEDKEGKITYRGSIVRTSDGCGISRTHYSRNIAVLVDMGCITVLGRDGFAGPTLALLHRAPEPDEIDRWDLTRGPKSDRSLFEARITQLERLVGGISVVDLAMLVEKLVNTKES